MLDFEVRRTNKWIAQHPELGLEPVKLENNNIWHPMSMYCLRCRDRRTVTPITYVTYNNKPGTSRIAFVGTCPSCGAKVSKLTSRDTLAEHYNIFRPT